MHTFFAQKIAESIGWKTNGFQYEIVKDKNYAPNNTMILVWDFGVPISLVALLLSSNTI